MTTVCAQNDQDTRHLSPSSSHLPSKPAGNRGSQTVSKSGEILPLTSLRFFAAFHVLLFHVWGIFLPSMPGPRYWNDLVRLGYAGVSIFFILSGYILTVVYLQHSSSVAFNRRKFYIARFARVYPLYALSLLVLAPFIWRDLGTLSLPYRIIKFAGLCVTNFGMIQAWRPAFGGGWNVPAWSVSAEAFFYLVFPVIGLAIATRIKKPLRLGLIFWLSSIAISLTLCKVAHSSHLSHDNFGFARCNPLLRLPEFLIGVCAAQWRPRVVSKSLSWMSVLVYLGLIPFIARLPELVVSNGLLAPIFVALVVGLGTLNGNFERLLSSPVLVTLGHASYSLYLLHLPVLFWLTHLLRTPESRELGGPWIIPFGPAERLTAYVVVTVVASILSYNLVEKPVRQYLLNRLPGSGIRI
jgi:peptidoglycan/LPS O-acetylase OafA/YrhL